MSATYPVSASSRQGIARLRAIENMAIPGLTRPAVPRFVTGANMDPFNNNAAHMSKMHGVQIETEKNLLMPLRMDDKLGQSQEWKDAERSLDKRMQLIERDGIERCLDIPEYKPEQFETDQYGYMQIDIAPQVLGRRWDSTTRAFLQAFRPSRVILLDNETDPPFEAMWWRITVKLNDLGRITWCKQEVRVPLPKGVNNGAELKAKTDNKV